jgi:V8-like Glu-specific endopeptidase
MTWCLLALIALGGSASGCGSPGSHATRGAVRPRAQATKTTSAQPSHAIDYWTRERLLTARPWRRWDPLLSPGTASVALAAAGETVPLAPEATQVEASRVGALFDKDASGNHFCTASVVASPGHDLVMTAAHCVNDGRGHDKNDLVFIPGYAAGATPYGVWTPRRVVVDPKWARGGDSDYDVGFVVLNSRDGKNIQDVLGANKIGFNTGFTHLVRVTGYPDTDDAPVTCRNWTSEHSMTQLRFECGGFYDGTSGSPWMTADPRQIVGIIGGYQQGGATDDVSYSVYLGDDIQQLYKEAESAG